MNCNNKYRHFLSWTANDKKWHIDNDTKKLDNKWDSELLETSIKQVVFSEM